MVDLAQLLAFGTAHARKVLLERRERALAPLYHLVASDGSQRIVPVRWSNDLQKQLMIAIVKDVAREIAAEAVLFMGEGWMLTIPQKDAPRDLSKAPLPSRSPDRVEIVQIVVSDSTTTDGVALRIVRNEGGRIIALEELDSPIGGSNRFWLSSRLTEGIIPTTTTQH